MFLLDSLLISSLRFVLDKLLAAAEAEAHDDTALRERLLEAQMKLELGELSEEEFVGIERDVLARLREIRESRGGDISLADDDSRVVGVEATIADELKDS